MAGAVKLTMERAGEKRLGRLRIACLLLLALCAALLLAVPEARRGAGALLNRLFALSEARNRYRYERFAVPDGQDVRLAAAVLCAACLAWAGLLATSERGWLPGATALLLFGAQAYLGLSLPAWGNTLLFGCLAALGAYRLPGRARLRCAAAVLVLLSLAASLWPGVDPGVEAASERVRDTLSEAVSGRTESDEAADAETSKRTRHERTLSQDAGGGEAWEVRSYQLVQEEEARISRPHWVDIVRIVLLLLAALAVVILPFAPFALANARRRQARAARTAFDAPDNAEAIRAMMRCAAGYLEASGLGGGNAPLRAWPAKAGDRLPEDYRERFSDGAEVFEQALYSDRPCTDEQRKQLRALLEETERLLYEQAGWKQRWKLRYIDCLHE